jgi:hypothetical protein
MVRRTIVGGGSRCYQQLFASYDLLGTLVRELT